MLPGKSACLLLRRLHGHLKTLDTYPSPEKSLKNLSTCIGLHPRRNSDQWKSPNYCNLDHRCAALCLLIRLAVFSHIGSRSSRWPWTDYVAEGGLNLWSPCEVRDSEDEQMEESEIVHHCQLPSSEELWNRIRCRVGQNVSITAAARILNWT